MARKKIILPFVLLLCCLTAAAQEPSVSWGPIPSPWKAFYGMVGATKGVAFPTGKIVMKSGALVYFTSPNREAPNDDGGVVSLFASVIPNIKTAADYENHMKKSMRNMPFQVSAEKLMGRRAFKHTVRWSEDSFRIMEGYVVEADPAKDLWLAILINGYAGKKRNQGDLDAYAAQIKKVLGTLRF